MQTLAKATEATTNSTIELILTPRPRAGYAGIKSRVGFRMITSFPKNRSVAGDQVRAFVPRQLGTGSEPSRKIGADQEPNSGPPRFVPGGPILWMTDQAGGAATIARRSFQLRPDSPQ
jgi:hypothetical protein